MHTAKVTFIGDSLGIILPQDVIALLHASEGDVLKISETSNGIELTPCNTDFPQQMQVAEKIMEKRRDLLRRLAE